MPAGRRVRSFISVLAVAAVAFSAGAPVAAAAERHSSQQAGSLERGDRGSLVRAVQRRLRVPADGVFGPRTERAVRRFQRRRGLTADGIVGSRTLAALGLNRRKTPPKDPTTGGTRETQQAPSRVNLPAALRRIAQCESGGNPRAVSADGRYRGKFQFDRATWRGMGGRGYADEAPEEEQDRRALRLYRERGTAPWSNCA